MIKLTTPGQHGIRDLGKTLAQCKQQRLRSGHVKHRRIVREKLLFKNSRVGRTDGLSQRVAHGTFEPGVVLHRDQVRMILS